MPSYVEQYPKTQHRIEFESLSDLTKDRKYPLWAYPAFERPRQLTLIRIDVTLFKSIPRDFCILNSPGFVSGQTRDSQKEPKLDIFHTDVVNIPETDLEARFQTGQPGWSDSSNSNRYHREGLTRANFEKIFEERFGLTVPLSSETSSDQWVPAVILYTAEVEKDVWQDRLAVVFDGKVGIFQQSMKHRTEAYDQNPGHQVLGKLYLDLWRARWAEGNDKDRFLDEKINSGKTTKIPVDDTQAKTLPILEEEVERDEQC